MKKTIVTGLLAFVALSTQAQKKIEYVEYDLPNGIHVIIHEEHSTPNVAVSILYHVGSKNETPERTGFAHFFEHLLFEGSANIGRGECTLKLTTVGVKHKEGWLKRKNVNVVTISQTLRSLQKCSNACLQCTH